MACFLSYVESGVGRDMEREEKRKEREGNKKG
jgi:hypothetical protein